MSEVFVSVPARDVPLPKSVSPEAQAGLAAHVERKGVLSYPDNDDADSWRAVIKSGDDGLIEIMRSRADLDSLIDSSPIDMNGAPAFLQKAKAMRHGDKVVLNIHGGALILGSGEACRLMGTGVAINLSAVTYSLDYRMPPDHPYPAALDDCVAAYRYLLDRYDPNDIVVTGASAGGNLAAALMLRARDEGLPLPAGCILATPETDLTESGDSFQTNAYFDVVLTGSLMAANKLYAGGHDLAHPYISPLLGDVETGFPPTLQTVGTRDLFLSNGVRLHNRLRRAGLHSELVVEEGMPHGGFGGAPEDVLIAADQRDFAERAWAGKLVGDNHST